MYLSESLSDCKLDVTIKPATIYSAVDNIYADRPDPLTSWLILQAGADRISLRLTWEQLNALHAVLGALLTDHSVQEDAILRAAGSGDCPECREALRGGPGHSDPPEVLPDRDPTQPGVIVPAVTGSNTYRVNGNVVTFAASEDWRLIVKTLNDSTAGVDEFPSWDTYGEALAWLGYTLEHRPATAKS